jgi:hypothetical protein
MAVGANIPKIETDVLMIFTTLISFVIIAFAIFPHSIPARFIRRNSTIYLPSTNTTHPTKHLHHATGHKKKRFARKETGSNPFLHVHNTNNL